MLPYMGHDLIQLSLNLTMNNSPTNSNNVNNHKLPEALKKKLLLSNANYNVSLVNNSGSVTYAAAYVGYLNFGPLEAVENDPSNQIFVNLVFTRF